MSSKNNPELPERWLAKGTVANYYSVSVRTVERWQHAGCPSMLLGGVRRLRLSEVQSWLRAQGLSEEAA